MLPLHLMRLTVSTGHCEMQLTKEKTITTTTIYFTNLLSENTFKSIYHINQTRVLFLYIALLQKYDSMQAIHKAAEKENAHS